MSETRKVAICGTAPSSLDEAPFHDESWEIWGTSRLWKQIPRADIWFELHPVDEIGRGWNVSEAEREQSRQEHIEWMGQAGVPVYLQEEDGRIPTGVPYPLEDIEAFLAEEFGDEEFYWTNSISYMIAMAIFQDVDEIGIWGVDMALNSEYRSQRPSCEYFIGLARGYGIPTHIPKTADLLKTAVKYGYDWELEEAFRAKIDARNNELEGRKKTCKQQREKLYGEAKKLEGCIQTIGAVLENGTGLSEDDKKALKAQAEQFQGQYDQYAQKMNELEVAKQGFSMALDNMEWVERTWLGCRSGGVGAPAEEVEGTPELEVVGGA